MFVCFLAVADLMVGLSMPYHIVTLALPGVTQNFYVCMFRFFTIFFPGFASVLLLLGMISDKIQLVE